MEYHTQILANFPRLMGATNFDDTLVTTSFQCGVMTKEEQLEVMAIKDSSDRKEAFWRVVANKPRDIGKFITALEVIEQNTAAKRIQETSYPMVDKEYPFLDDIKPYTVKIWRPLRSHGTKDDDEYKLDPDAIGMALIINITEYEDPKQNRKGSHDDTKYMSELWSQLGYKVTKYEGTCTKQMFVQFTEDFINRFKTKSFFQSLVVFVGCHGDSNRNLIMSDDGKVDLFTDLILKFNKGNLKEKPKIFIVQSCAKICENDHNLIASDISNSAIFASSTRHSRLGSYFVYVLTHVIMREAHRSELQKILSKVEENLDLLLQDTRKLPDIKYVGMKKLYFNVQPESLS